MDPVAVLEDNEILEFPETMDDDVKDEDYVPDNESEDDMENYEVDVDEDGGSESDNEEIPAVTDKVMLYSVLDHGTCILTLK